jgi:hypothetical protein
MILASFGDSFIHGTDLDDCVPGNQEPRILIQRGDDGFSSKKTWPALCAKKLNYHYECYAHAGIGNQQILEKLIPVIEYHKSNCFYVINWTWIDRFDYIDKLYDTWQTVRPSLDNKKIDSFYYKYLHSEYQDKFSTLCIVDHALRLLNQYKCQFIMTCHDKLLLDENYHTSDAVTLLQSNIRPYIHYFNNQNLVDWSKKQNLEISESGHPLEEAHEKASEYMLSVVNHLLNTHAKEDYLHAFK